MAPIPPAMPVPMPPKLPMLLLLLLSPPRAPGFVAVLVKEPVLAVEEKVLAPAVPVERELSITAAGIAPMPMPMPVALGNPAPCTPRRLPLTTCKRKEG